jgi:hypothetical protein
MKFFEARPHALSKRMLFVMTKSHTVVSDPVTVRPLSLGGITFPSGQLLAIRGFNDKRPTSFDRSECFSFSHLSTSVKKATLQFFTFITSTVFKF